jgi:hypothetical protein
MATTIDHFPQQQDQTRSSGNNSAYLTFGQTGSAVLYARTFEDKSAKDKSVKEGTSLTV